MVGKKEKEDLWTKYKRHEPDNSGAGGYVRV